MVVTNAYDNAWLAATEAKVAFLAASSSGQAEHPGGGLAQPLPGAVPEAGNPHHQADRQEAALLEPPGDRRVSGEVMERRCVPRPQHHQFGQRRRHRPARQVLHVPGDHVVVEVGLMVLFWLTPVVYSWTTVSTPWASTWTPEYAYRTIAGVSDM